MTIALTPLIVALIGLLMYLFAPSSKAQRIGEILFFVGAFGFVVAQNGHAATFEIK